MRTEQQTTSGSRIIDGQLVMFDSAGQVIGRRWLRKWLGDPLQAIGSCTIASWS